MKRGGLAVPNPCEIAEFALTTWNAMKRHLVTSLVEDDILFDPNKYPHAVSLASMGTRKDPLTREQLVLEERGEHNAATKRKDERM